ncbi:MAG TPA: imidazolonepropionase [Geobacterales bacterium]|nr:imidazolonepropionase [Geobacterales bacterium]
MEYDLVIKAKQLVTLRGGVRVKEKMKELNIIEDGMVAIKDKRISYVGEKKTVNSKEEISTGVAMPSFIDAHTHLLFYGSREDEFEMRIEGLSYNEILKKGGGIWRTVDETKKAGDAEILKVAKERLCYLLEHGTTVVEIKSGYGIDPKEEIRELRLINELKNNSELTIVPTLLAHLKKDKKWLKDFIEIIPFVAYNNLAKFVDSFCDLGALSYEDTDVIFAEAKKYGLGLKAHVGELEDIGCGKLVEKYDLASIDHIVYLDEKSLEQAIKKGTCGVLLPATTFSLMQNHANAKKYIEKGLIVALASDFSPASWISDMQSVISIACRELKMTQAECIAASTINAAYSLGIHNDYGSIEEGKFADITTFDVPNYKWIGYTLGYNHVEIVIKHGKKVLER